MENPGKLKTVQRCVGAISGLLMAFSLATVARAVGDDALETSLRADVTMLAETIGPRADWKS